MIQIDELSVRFGQVCAVDQLSLHIEEGSLFGLLGPNGAGKTTTISCIAGLRTPAAGSVRVAGHEVAREPVAVRRMLGLVPQSLALYPTLSVVRNLRLFGGLFGLGGKRLRERVAWGLELAQLEGKADAAVQTLSGGMKRRLNLACALLHDPPLIICDEPTTGVDPQSRNHPRPQARRLRPPARHPHRRRRSAHRLPLRAGRPDALAAPPHLRGHHGRGAPPQPAVPRPPPRGAAGAHRRWCRPPLSACPLGRCWPLPSIGSEHPPKSVVSGCPAA